jgi:serine/threonine-protein kinase
VVSLWQASIARRESQTAAAVETFLTGIFKANSSYQSNPENARKTTARELLDIGAKRIATELQDAPEAKLRMLTLLAELYKEVTLAEPALALYRQQVELLRQIEPADSVKLALAFANLGDRAAQANAKEESQKAYGEAIAILDRRGDTATPERGRVEAQLAGALLDWMDPQALETAKRAVSILKRHSPSEELLWAMEVQAILTSQKGERRASLKLVREALEIALGMPGVNHHALVGLHLSVGRQLSQNNQVEAAEASMRTAYEMALAKEGPDSHLTVNAALEIGTLFYRNGEYVKSLAVFGPAANSAQRALDKGDRSWLNLVVVANHGETLMKLGKVENGLEIPARAQKARDILDVQPPRDTMLREQVAEAHAMMGTHSAAEFELDAAQKVIGEKMQGNKREIENLIRARLRCALIRRDKLRTPDLAAQTKLANVPADETPNAALRRLVLLAEAQFVAGDHPGALMAATQLINTLPQSTAPTYDGDRERRASLVAGKVHVLQGRAELALPLLQRAVSLAEGRLDTQTSADHADALIWLGQAQLATGNTQEAKQMTRLAKEIHNRHPKLEEAFRKPLAILNERLRALP